MEKVHDLGSDHAAPGVSLGDVLRYGALFGQIVETINAAKHLKAGESMEPDMAKFHLNGGSFEWDLGTLKKVR